MLRDFLRWRAGAEILIFLLTHDESNLGTVHKGVGRSERTVYDGINNLLRLNLLSEREENNQRLFSLTEDGRKIAEDLKEIQDILARKSLEKRLVQA